MTTPDPRQEPIQIHARKLHEYVSVREAAARLGTSESDIRRKIKAGTLVAESLPRPGGTILRVRVDTPEAAPEPRQSAPDPRQETEAAVMLALVTELAAHREQAQETAAMVADLREALGHAGSDAAAASARASDLAEQLRAADALLLADAETIEHQAVRLDRQASDLISAVRAGAVLSAELESSRLMADALGRRLQAAELAAELSARSWWVRIFGALGW